MPDKLKDWRETLYQPTGGVSDVRPDKRIRNNVLYTSVAAMEEAKAREESEESEAKRERVKAAIAAKYAGL